MDSPVMADRRWRNTGRLLYAGFECYEARVLASLHSAGYGQIRRTHFSLIRHMDTGGTRMSELAARANLTKAAMTGLVRAVEEMELVRVESAPDDGRARLVYFTVKGEEMMRYLRATVQMHEEQMRERLGAESYEMLRAALLQLDAG